MYATRTRLLIALSIALLALSACNFPAPDAEPTESGPQLVMTYAAQTVEAQLTLAATSIQPTFTPGPPGETPSPTPGNGDSAPTATPETGAEPTATPTSETPCDRAEFVEDVTIPDGTDMEPGEDFTKIWRLENTGTCTWDSDYAIVFERGDAMGAPASLTLADEGESVAPGEEVDIALDLEAPDDDGEYQGFFLLRNGSGQKFGLGSDADEEFWVQIDVGLPGGIQVDFIALASSADWSASGGGDTVDISFGGIAGSPASDPNGVAMLVEGIELENGATAGKTLFTRPKQNNDGQIQGIFPEYTVRGGDRFIARLGFLDNCGNGEVEFKLRYRQGNSIETIESWDESCGGGLTLVDIGLADLEDETVQFVFEVLADGSPEDDLAVWASPRIER